ncbi:MAG: iron-sulfur cluster assembly scaffold protein [Blastocatellia bacterium]
MYSPEVLDHLDNPRNAGELENATARGEAGNPVCGDLLHLYLRIENDTIVAAGFLAQGCPPSIAAGSALTEMIRGLALTEAARLAPRDVTTRLGGLPRNKEHCSILAIDALRAALRNSAAT